MKFGCWAMNAARPSADVDMGVVESGHEHLPAKVDDPRRIIGIYELVAADSQNYTVADGDRFVRRKILVQGHDFSVVKQKVCALFLRASEIRKGQ